MLTLFIGLQLLRRRATWSCAQRHRGWHSLRAILVVLLVIAAPGASKSQEPLPSPTATVQISEGEVIGSGAEAIPLETFDESTAVVIEDTSAWWNPTSWVAGPAWEKGIEVGINGSEGNAQAFSILTSGRLKRKTEQTTWGIDVTYGKTEANDVLTQHYAFLNSRWDYNLGEGRWSLFNIARLEFDEFKAFDWRLALNGGLGYDIIQRETLKLTGRFGAGTSREFGGLDEEWVPEAVYGADYEHELSKKQKISITTDYYPAWDDFSDYRLVTQASWELLIDEASNLSLKLGFLDRYDSTPGGLQANDVDYFITLLWKM